MARNQKYNSFAAMIPEFNAGMPIDPIPLERFYRAENDLLAKAGCGPAGGILVYRYALDEGVVLGVEENIVSMLLPSPRRDAVLRCVVDAGQHGGVWAWRIYNKTTGQYSPYETVSTPGEYRAEISVVGTDSIHEIEFLAHGDISIRSITYDWLEVGAGGSWPYTSPPLPTGEIMPGAVAADDYDASQLGAVSADALLEIRERAWRLMGVRRAIATAGWIRNVLPPHGIYGSMGASGVPFTPIEVGTYLRLDLLASWTDDWRIWIQDEAGRELWEERFTGTGGEQRITLDIPAHKANNLFPGGHYFVYATGCAPINVSEEDFYVDVVSIYALTLSVNGNATELPSPSEIASGARSRGVVLQTFSYIYALLQFLHLPRICTWWVGGASSAREMGTPDTSTDNYSAALPWRRMFEGTDQRKITAIYGPSWDGKTNDSYIRVGLPGDSGSIDLYADSTVNLISSPIFGGINVGFLESNFPRRSSITLNPHPPNMDLNFNHFISSTGTHIVCITVEESGGIWS